MYIPTYILFIVLYILLYTYLWVNHLHHSCIDFPAFLLTKTQLQVWGVSLSWGYNLEGTRWAWETWNWWEQQNGQMFEDLFFLLGKMYLKMLVTMIAWILFVVEKVRNMDQWEHWHTWCKNLSGQPVDLMQCCQVHLHQLACQVARCAVKDTWYNIYIYIL